MRTARSLLVLLLSVGASLAGSRAEAQVVRPSESVYVLLRGGAAGYYGDRQTTTATITSDQLVDGFDRPGLGLGAEVGLHVADDLSVGLGLGTHGLPVLDGRAIQAQALARYLPFPDTRVTSYLEAGLALILGEGTEADRGTGSADDRLLGYGPVFGAGFDVLLTPQTSAFLGVQATVVVPDAALDGGDAGAFGSTADAVDVDVLSSVGGGLRFALRAGGTAVTIEGLECPAELETGEAGAFTVVTNADATAPVQAMWQFGDGETASGATLAHAYRAAGTYTVTATAVNEVGEASDSCLVTVADPPPVDPPVPAPTLAGCRATPSQTQVGQSLTISATATGADDIVVDFGDGTTASSLPARNTFTAEGRYIVMIIATNATGSDTCRIEVTVVHYDCFVITELNPVFFGYGSTTLSADARDRLDENIELLRRCPDLCVTIDAYSDGAEPGDARQVSQARADATLAYYVGQGLDADRFRAVGRGVAPGATPKEDPGPGDARARRADSIPGSCVGF